MYFNEEIEKISLKFKNKKALIDINSNKSLSYGELFNDILSIKEFLLSRGLKSGDEVASVLDNSIENLEYFLSCCYLGLVYLPQSNEITEYELKKLFEDTNIKTFLISDTTNLKIKKILLNSKVKIININQQLKKNKNKKIKKKLPILIVNSSGTTGDPKKIMIDVNRLWQSAKNFAKNYQFLSSKNTFYNFLPMSYLGGLFNLGIIPLSIGSTVIIDKQFSGNTFLTFWNKVKQYNIDILWLVPTILRGLITMSEKVKMNYKNYKVLPKACFLGTANCSLKEKKKFEKIFKIPIFENYGTSETTFISLESKLTKKNKTQNIGKIISCLKYKIKNKTLHIKSPFNFLGYYNKKIKNNFKNVNSSFYDTGDICEITKNNFLIFKGRKREIIKKGGLLISLKEVNEIFQINHSVVESYALPIRHEFYGEDYLIFFTTKKDVNSKKIEIWFRDQVPRYKWPKEIIKIKKFKKTASGKINIVSLKKKYSNNETN